MHCHGELYTFQKQAMINLIGKKDKDKRLLNKLRPILLINMDVKIAPNTMAMRLGSILPFLVHHSQKAFMKGRSIFDTIRTINDILKYAKRNNRLGILIAIDFEKVFDSRNQIFMVTVLQQFNFWKHFLPWIQTFYTKTIKLLVKQFFLFFLCLT